MSKYTNRRQFGKKDNGATISSGGEKHNIRAIDRFGCVFSQTIEAKSRSAAIVRFTLQRWSNK